MRKILVGTMVLVMLVMTGCFGSAPKGNSDGDTKAPASAPVQKIEEKQEKSQQQESVNKKNYQGDGKIKGNGSPIGHF